MTFAEAVADLITEPQPGRLGKLAQVGGIPLSVVDAEEDERRREEAERASKRRRNAILGTLAAGASLAGLGYLGYKNRDAIKGWWDKTTGGGPEDTSLGDKIRSATPSMTTTLGVGAGLESARQARGALGRASGTPKMRQLVDRMRGSLSSEAGKLEAKPAAPSGSFFGRLFGKSPSAAADIEKGLEGSYKPLWEAVGPSGAKGDVSHKKIRANIADELSNLLDPSHKGPNAFRPFVAAARDKSVRGSTKDSMRAAAEPLRSWRAPQALSKQLRRDIAATNDHSLPRSVREAASARLQNLAARLGLPTSGSGYSTNNARIFRQIADTIDAGLAVPSHLNVARYPGAAISRTLGPMVVGTGLPTAVSYLADLGK